MDMEDDFRHAQETIEMVMEDVRIELADAMNLHHIDRDAVTSTNQQSVRC